MEVAEITLVAVVVVHDSGRSNLERVKLVIIDVVEVTT